MRKRPWRYGIKAFYAEVLLFQRYWLLTAVTLLGENLARIPKVFAALQV